MVKDLSESVKDLSESVADLRKAVTTGNPAPVQPPTDPEGVKHALRNPATRMESARTFGFSWLMETKDNKLWPTSALEDEAFMLHYLEQKKLGGKTESASAFQPAASAGLLTSANHQAMAPFGKTASDSLPANMLAPSIAGTSFPFAAALPGKHVKIDLPKPSKFSRIAVDSDICAWLLRMQEYLTISGVEPGVWVVFASNYLDKAPLQLWEARKTQMCGQPGVLYSWDIFRDWCISSFSVHNHERHALAQLEKLRQTGIVAECKAAHDVLAAQTNLPMQLRIFWWERGLKDDIRSTCSVDPLTQTEYTDIEKAQSAACAYDAHLTSASAAAANRKHGRSLQLSAASASGGSKGDRPKRGKFSDLRDNKAPIKVAKWSGDSPESFTCDREGSLAEPLPGFFKEWVLTSCTRSTTTDEPLLPTDLVKLGKLDRGTCFYRGCQQAGHRWDHCPSLAMHVAKNPTVRHQQY